MSEPITSERLRELASGEVRAGKAASAFELRGEVTEDEMMAPTTPGAIAAANRVAVFTAASALVDAIGRGSRRIAESLDRIHGELHR